MSDKYKFSVDTSLFRELGELLVARDSTALMELVKNSYDADATNVELTGVDLRSSGGRIVVKDDGIGMTLDEFVEGFLRIASRNRSAETRLSVKYRRRYTGEKGVGRLAAHKLAAKLYLFSTAQAGIAGRETNVESVKARLDWDEIEKFETMDEISSGISVESIAGAEDHGTTIELTDLRKSWSEAELRSFLGELEAFRLPSILVAPPYPDLVSESILFDSPIVSTTGSDDAGFHLKPLGDFAVADDYWDELGLMMNWVVELDATTDQVRIGIAPTKLKAEKSPTARPAFAEFEHPGGGNGPYFHARILVREQGIRGPLRDFARRASGIRVYSEGFRVLPYGESTDDWLRLDRDYAARPREFGLQPASSDADLRQLRREGYYSLGNLQYYGAVFLTTERAPNLEMVVSREGFVPNAQFLHMQKLVRNAVDLSVRARAALGAREKAATKTDEEESTTEPVAAALIETKAAIDEVGSHDLTGDVPGVAAIRLTKAAEALIGHVDRLRDQQSLMRVLASVGSELASFVHEVNGLVAQSQTIRGLVGKLRNETDIESLAAFRYLVSAVDELVEMLARQSAYMFDVLGADSRQRRSPQRVLRRLESLLASLEPWIASRQLDVRIDVPDGVKTPGMYPSEVSIILRNLMTNAIKAAGEGGRIRITGRVNKGGDTVVTVRNTGVRVDLNTADRWFESFQSTTIEIDPVLGQGMGLGLTITRDTVADYGGTVQFVPPGNGYATAVKVVLPKGRRVKSGVR